MLSQTHEVFSEKFDSQPEILGRAPGRINFLGEHTDYNEGFVLPAAIDKEVNVAIASRTDNVIRLYAKQFDEFYEIPIYQLAPLKDHWSNYVLGVVDQLLKRSLPVRGFNLVLDGNIPQGAGLSSSAAVECATAVSLDKLFGLGLSKHEMAFLAQAAEHTYPGVKCGIMDQYASMFGKQDQIIKLDCRSNEHEYIPLVLEGHTLILFDSMVKHSLASSEYNVRRSQCNEGVMEIKKHVPGVHSLRDVTMEMIQEYITDPLIRRRCSYVVEENLRVGIGCDKLLDGNLKGFGRLMFKTHDGLSNDYEVSCRELDILVEAVRNEPSVIGARMMGGGFGGCTLNIIEENAVGEIIEKVSEVFHKQTGQSINYYTVAIKNGADTASI